MRSNCQRDAARFLTHIYGTFGNLPEMKRFALSRPRDHLRNKFFKKKQMTALAELRHFESIKMELKGAKIFSNYLLYFISTLSHRELDSTNYIQKCVNIKCYHEKNICE